jgi:hypothetical protein
MTIPVANQVTDRLFLSSYVAAAGKTIYRWCLPAVVINQNYIRAANVGLYASLL